MCICSGDGGPKPALYCVSGFGGFCCSTGYFGSPAGTSFLSVGRIGPIKLSAFVMSVGCCGPIILPAGFKSLNDVVGFTGPIMSSFGF